MKAPKHKEVPPEIMADLFPASEGMIAQYYGRIGSGKTYAATSDILDLLRRGKVVYANWRIHYEGDDERRSFGRIIFSLILPWRKRFFEFPRENLIYFELSDKWAVANGHKDFATWLGTRTDCYIFADEGHIMFDSYAGTRMSIDKRTAILHTRHFNRSLYIVSQRPTAIHVSMRANVNVFYKCEVAWALGNWILFRRTEFQEMMNENVDENEEKVSGVKYYFGKQAVFNSYDTKYLRGDTPSSQKLAFRAFDFSYFRRWLLLFVNIFSPKALSTAYPQESEMRKIVVESSDEQTLIHPHRESVLQISKGGLLPPAKKNTKLRNVGRGLHNVQALQGAEE